MGVGETKFCFIEEVKHIMPTRPQHLVARKGIQCMVMKREEQLNYIRCGILCVYLLPLIIGSIPVPNIVSQQPPISYIGAQKITRLKTSARNYNRKKEKHE